MGIHNRKAIAALCLALLVCLALEPLISQAATVLKRGSKGELVTQAQKKLKQWGYYDGSVDGIFGSGTKKAVERFQKRNGLVVDGMIGSATSKAMGLNLGGGGSTNTSTNAGGSSSNSNSNLYLLARVVYGEARGEPYKGQVAVAAIVLNRVESSEFPNTISGVVYQSGAFSIVSDGQINLTPDETSLKAARDAMNGWDPTNGCLYYFNPSKTKNKWMHSRPKVITIGQHVFTR